MTSLRIPIIVLLAFAIVAGLVAVAARITLDRRMVQRLQREHAPLWAELGEPRGSFSRLEDVSGLHRFVFDAKYAEVGDATLQRDRATLRRVHVVTYALAAAVLGLGVALRLMRP